MNCETKESTEKAETRALLELDRSTPVKILAFLPHRRVGGLGLTAVSAVLPVILEN